MAKYKLLFCLIVCGVMGSAVSVAENVSWSDRAINDIEAAYSIIRDNHPGPVDEANPNFKVWLEEGREKALVEARRANTSGDARRSVDFYINGFRDNHIWVRSANVSERSWPGFLSQTNAQGTTTVQLTEGNTYPPIGAVLEECDGIPALELLATRVEKIRLNPDLPHQRDRLSPFLFVAERDDEAFKLKSCTFIVNGMSTVYALNWKRIDSADLLDKVSTVNAMITPNLGIRQINGVWFVSVPTFNWWDDDAPKMHAFIADLEKRRSELQSAPIVVIDVRGNNGGNSEWADKIVGKLWGDKVVETAKGSFDQSTSWRVSKKNVEMIRSAAAASASGGLPEDAQYRNDVAQKIERLIATGAEFHNEPMPPKGSFLPNGYRSPFRGRVMLLTDYICASSCLDFADIVLRLPGVIHVGLPTGADAVYIDTAQVPLPSGDTLAYGLKVYRNRIRSNNQFYEPAVKWTGGPMRDEAIAYWLRNLDTAP